MARRYWQMLIYYSLYSSTRQLNKIDDVVIIDTRIGIDLRLIPENSGYIEGQSRLIVADYIICSVSIVAWLRMTRHNILARWLHS